MYNFREGDYKSRNTDGNPPSFSSTLLDEIYRSIDEKTEDFKGFKEKPVMKMQLPKLREEDDDEEIESSPRSPCLVEKWMVEKSDDNEKLAARLRRRRPPPPCPDNDLVLFSSTSSSPDSSGALSSSDTEFFSSGQKKPKVSCFSTRPKPVRTTRDNRNCQSTMNHHDNEDLPKYKSRALSIYENLKKLKQPISPGGRLTSFLNYLFSNNGGGGGGNQGKKSRNGDGNGSGFRDLNSKPPNVALSSSSTCSSASSLSRSCLSKYSPKSGEKIRNRDGVRRTVRFHPVSVIVDEDCRPCGHKSLFNEDPGKCRRPPLAPNAELKFSKMERINREVEVKGINDISLFRKAHELDDDSDEDSDGISDSSSDLFELDHSKFFGSNRFSEELPVYETTRLENNLAIVGRLVR